jgi:hypothetical protein
MERPSSSESCVEELELMLTQGGETTQPSESLLSHIHRCPIDQGVPLLERLLWHSTDSWTQERAFQCLMNLDGFDQVRFLSSNLSAEPDNGRRTMYCLRLAAFQDPRAIRALCTALVSDEDGDVRFAAAAGLRRIGDESALPVLDHAAWHDTGTDWEGRIIAELAWKAAQRIRGEPGARRPISEWMADQRPTPLREIVANLNTLANYLDVFGKREETWNADSVMVLVPPTEYWGQLDDEYHLRYLHSVALTKQLLKIWTDERAGQIPTVDEACELLLEYDRKRQAQSRADFERSEARLRDLAREREGLEDKPFDPAELDDLPF